MFIGIDHGTTGIRFALLENTCSSADSETSARIYEISRERAASLQEREILREIERAFGVKLSDVRLVAVSYSMGDGISKITDLHAAKNRGLREEVAAAGLKVGGGTRVFDAIKSSGVPAVLIPRDSRRFAMFRPENAIFLAWCESRKGRYRLLYIQKRLQRLHFLRC